VVKIDLSKNYLS